MLSCALQIMDGVCFAYFGDQALEVKRILIMTVKAWLKKSCCVHVLDAQSCACSSTRLMMDWHVLGQEFSNFSLIFYRELSWKCALGRKAENENIIGLRVRAKSYGCKKIGSCSTAQHAKWKLSYKELEIKDKLHIVTNYQTSAPYHPRRSKYVITNFGRLFSFLMAFVFMPWGLSGFHPLLWRAYDEGSSYQCSTDGAHGSR